MCNKSENSYILYQLLKAKQNMENQLDLIRCQLCQNANFNVFNLFNQLDANKKGRLGIQDLLNFLIKNSLNATLQQIEIVLRYFTNDIFIALPSFVTMLIPKNMKQINDNLSSVDECFIKFILTLIDHSQQMKKISKQSEQIDENTFDFSFGFSTQFTPTDLIKLYSQFQDQPSGNTFLIVFGSLNQLKWEQIKSNSNWKLEFKRRQARQSLCLYQRKTSFQRKSTIQSIILSQGSTDSTSPHNPQSNKIKFCTNLDMDVFERETYLYN